MKIRLPKSYYNIISYIGTTVAVIALFMFIFLYVLSSLARYDKAYIGLVDFIVIPTFIIIGLILIPVGMIIKTRQQRKAGGEISRALPVLDLNLPRQRNGLIIFTAGTIIFLFLSGLGSYKAYHFTESNQFCGTLCHNLMIPEFTAYQHSPHARVHCAECHIGPGASWYVKSKLSGLYQVYATIFNRYPRPIPTPIKSLRPVRETCEQCHWPQKVYGAEQRAEIFYLSDTENTRWEIDMLMHTGGGNPALGHSVGIHWHINKNIDIVYIATDKKRSNIPRIIKTNLSTGEKVIYNNVNQPLDESKIPNYQTRTMDCIDCHNRPTHIYRTPSDFIDIAMAEGNIDPNLPMIKQTAVEACEQDYNSTPDAHKGISEYIQNYYTNNYAKIDSTNSAMIDSSIQGIQTAFSQNIFPEMKVVWSEYPDHIGHFTSPGCYRCHDGLHKSETGEVISHHCDYCHTIISQGKAGEKQFAQGSASLEFKHPVDIGEAWKETGCFECHAEM